MWNSFKEKVSGTWEWLKQAFNRSFSILLARAEMLFGFIVAAVSVADWSPLLTAGLETGFTATQAGIVGGMLFVKGIVSELARRHNTRTIEKTSQLVPENIVIKKVK